MSTYRWPVFEQTHRVDHEVDLLESDEPDRSRPSSTMTSTSASGSEVPQDLAAHLMVLAVSTGLALLVPEAGSQVPDLPGRDRVVLVEGPHHRRGALGSQGQVTATAVFEVVHLLAHDVGALAHPLEHADVLEHRRLEQTEAGRGRCARRTAATRRCHRSDSGANTSRVPGRGLESRGGHRPGRVSTRPPSCGYLLSFSLTGLFPRASGAELQHQRAQPPCPGRTR